MLKFKTSCAVLAYLSSNLLNEVGLSLFRYFEVGLRVCDIVVKKWTFAISSPDEFLYSIALDVYYQGGICQGDMGTCTGHWTSESAPLELIVTSLDLGWDAFDRRH